MKKLCGTPITGATVVVLPWPLWGFGTSCIQKSSTLFHFFWIIIALFSFCTFLPSFTSSNYSVAFDFVSYLMTTDLVFGWTCDPCSCVVATVSYFFPSLVLVWQWNSIDLLSFGFNTATPFCHWYLGENSQNNHRSLRRGCKSMQAWNNQILLLNLTNNFTWDFSYSVSSYISYLHLSFSLRPCLYPSISRHLSSSSFVSHSLFLSPLNDSLSSPSASSCLPLVTIL